MKSQSPGVIDVPATALSSAEGATDDLGKKFMCPNNVNLQAFAVRVAWAFTSAVLVLIVASLLLVVAGYAGSTFALDLQSKPVSSSSSPSPSGR